MLVLKPDKDIKKKKKTRPIFHVNINIKTLNQIPRNQIHYNINRVINTT